MTSYENRSDPQAEELQEFIGELDEVHAEMTEAVSDLGSPLRELVLRRIEDGTPLVRAALVLATGYSAARAERAQCVRLGAALELLRVSLGIHQRLLGVPVATTDGPDFAEDRSFIGSTILAGDFCFSLAAQMAAATESPTVVGIFAQALQDASEEQLRALDPMPEPALIPAQTYETRGRDQILLRAGAEAAFEFSDLQASLLPTLRELSAAVTDETCRAWSPNATWKDAANRLPHSHSLRWHAFSRWLAAQDEYRNTR